MEQNLFSGNLSPQEKKDNLEAMAYNIEKQFYHKPLTDAELQKYKDELTQAAIKKGALEAEYKLLAKNHKERIKPIAEKYAQCLDTIKNNGVLTEGNIYMIANHESGHMGYYNEEGELISMRRLLPEERQENLFISNLKNVM